MVERLGNIKVAVGAFGRGQVRQVEVITVQGQNGGREPAAEIARQPALAGTGWPGDADQANGVPVRASCTIGAGILLRWRSDTDGVRVATSPRGR